VDRPEDLFVLEAELQAPASRHDPAQLDTLLDPDFREFGSSGGVYDRRQTISALQSEPDLGHDLEMSDRAATAVAENVVLLTYLAMKRDRQGVEVSRSLRSSLWRRINGRWMILFHQGAGVDLWSRPPEWWKFAHGTRSI